MYVTEIPGSDFGPHKPAVEWGCGEFEPPTVKQNAGDRRQGIPTDPHLRQPGEPIKQVKQTRSPQYLLGKKKF